MCNICEHIKSLRTTKEYLQLEIDFSLIPEDHIPEVMENYFWWTETSKPIPIKHDCVCGAKFTSNPKYHLPFCK
jgi:hypothetical protein